MVVGRPGRMGVVPGKVAWIEVAVLLVGEGPAAWVWVLGEDVGSKV